MADFDVNAFLSEGDFDPDEFAPPGPVRDLGPRTTRASRDPARRGQRENVQEENERLGLDTGPIARDLINVPFIGALQSGNWGPSPVGNVMKKQRIREISEAVEPVKRVENALGLAAATMLGGGVFGPAAEASVIPTAESRIMASSAALQRANAARGGAAAAGGGILPALEQLSHFVHSPYLALARKMIPAAANVARSGAGPVAAGGVGVAGAAAARPIAGPSSQETPEQRAARILLGQSPNFVER